MEELAVLCCKVFSIIYQAIIFFQLYLLPLTSYFKRSATNSQYLVILFSHCLWRGWGDDVIVALKVWEIYKSIIIKRQYYRQIFFILLVSILLLLLIMMIIVIYIRWLRVVLGNMLLIDLHLCQVWNLFLSKILFHHYYFVFFWLWALQHLFFHKFWRDSVNILELLFLGV